MNNFKVGDRVYVALLEKGVIVSPIEGTRSYQVMLDVSSEIIEVGCVNLTLIED